MMILARVEYEDTKDGFASVMNLIRHHFSDLKLSLLLKDLLIDHPKSETFANLTHLSIMAGDDFEIRTTVPDRKFDDGTAYPPLYIQLFFNCSDERENYHLEIAKSVMELVDVLRTKGILKDVKYDALSSGNCYLEECGDPAFDQSWEDFFSDQNELSKLILSLIRHDALKLYLDTNRSYIVTDRVEIPDNVWQIVEKWAELETDKQFTVGSPIIDAWRASKESLQTTLQPMFLVQE